jgi:hypothetical protein
MTTHREEYYAVTEYYTYAIKHATSKAEWTSLVQQMKKYMKAFASHHKKINVRWVRWPSWKEVNAYKTHIAQLGTSYIVFGNEKENEGFVDGGDLEDTISNFHVEAEFFMEKMRHCHSQVEYQHYYHELQVLVSNYQAHHVSVSIPANCPTWQQVQSHL